MKLRLPKLKKLPKMSPKGWITVIGLTVVGGIGSYVLQIPNNPIQQEVIKQINKETKK